MFLKNIINKDIAIDQQRILRYVKRRNTTKNIAIDQHQYMIDTHLNDWPIKQSFR